MLPYESVPRRLQRPADCTLMHLCVAGDSAGALFAGWLNLMVPCSTFIYYIGDIAAETTRKSYAYSEATDGNSQTQQLKAGLIRPQSGLPRQEQMHCI